MQNAIKATFEKRGTLLEGLPDSFSEEFYLNPVHQNRWLTLLKNIRHNGNVELSIVINEIQEFLKPIIEALLENQIFRKKWTLERKWE